MAVLLKINSTNLPAMERARNIFLTHMTAVEKQKEHAALAKKIFRSAAEAGLRYAAGQKHPAIGKPPSAPTANATNVSINTGGSSSAFWVPAQSTPRPEALATVACTLYASPALGSTEPQAPLHHKPGSTIDKYGAIDTCY
jgi:hypothetical protein